MKRLIILMLVTVMLLCNINVVMAENTSIEVDIDSKMIGNIFFDADVAPFEITFNNYGEISQSINATYNFYSIGTDMERAECIATYTGDYSINQNSEQSLKISAPISDYGLYEFEVVLTNSRGEVIETKTVPFSNAVRNTQMNKTVGVNTHLIWWGDADTLLHLVKNAGMGTVRGGFSWDNYEKKKGEYKLSERTSKMLKAAEKYEIDVLGVLTPANIYDDGKIKSDFLRESEVDEYKAFLNVLLNEELVKNNVSKLEVMNEPSFLYDVVDGEEVGTDVAGMKKRAVAYGRMVKATNEVVDSLDKDYKIGILSLTGLTEITSKNFADLAFSELSPGDFDTLSLHPYVSAARNPESDLMKKSAREQSDYYKNLANGSVKGNSTKNTYNLNISEPMWHTEFGYSSSTGENSANMSVGDEYKQAEMIIRLMDEIKRDNPQDVTYIYEMSSDGTDLTDREDNFELIRSCYAENPYSAKFAYLAVANYNSLTANATTISRVESGNNITGGNYITKYEKDGCNVYLLRTTNSLGSTTRYDFGNENLYYYDLFGNKLEESDVKSGDAYKLTTVPYYIVSGEDVNRAEPENDTRMRAGEFVIRGRIPSGEENKKISVTLTDENAVFGTDSFEDDVFFWNQGVTGLNGTFEFTAKVYEKDRIKAHIVTEDDEMIVLEFGISVTDDGSIKVTSGGVNVDNLEFDKINLKDLSVSLDLGEKYTSYKMICALYNGDRLVNMKVYDKNLVAGNTSVTQSVVFDNISSDCDRLQIMTIKDFGTITPLCEAYIKE